MLDALNLRFQPDQINGVAHIRTLGSNTTHLPCFRFLNTTFLVEARTPAQWNPSEYEVSTTERLGQSHITPTVLSIASQSCVSTDTLLKVVEHGQACADGTKKNSSSSSAFSHFYHGLPNEIKEMIKTDSSSTLSPSSKLHKNTEDQIGPKFGKQRRKYLRAVQMLQRVYRSRGQVRTDRTPSYATTRLKFYCSFEQSVVSCGIIDRHSKSKGSIEAIWIECTLRSTRRSSTSQQCTSKRCIVPMSLVKRQKQ